MSKARKPRTLMQRAKATKEPDKAIWTLFEAARDELRKMAREGVVDADAADKYHPVRTLIRIEHDTTVPATIRLLAAKEILSYVEAPKSATLKLEANNPGDQSITIIVAPYAAAGGARRIEAAPAAIEAPREVDPPVEAEVVEPVEDPKRIVAFTPHGNPVSAERLAQLKDMQTDLSRSRWRRRRKCASRDFSPMRCATAGR